MHESEKWKWSHSVVSDSSRPHGPQPTRLLHPWDFPGKSTGVGCHCLLLALLLPFFFKFYFTILYWFAIHWLESAMSVHVFPILNPLLLPFFKLEIPKPIQYIYCSSAYSWHLIQIFLIVRTEWVPYVKSNLQKTTNHSKTQSLLILTWIIRTKAYTLKREWVMKHPCA